MTFSLRDEKVYPWAGGLFAAAGLITSQRIFLWDMPTGLSNLLAASINIAAIAVGFIAAAKSILFTIEKKDIVQRLKEMSGDGESYFKKLVRYMLESVNLSFVLAAISTAGLLVNANVTTWPGTIFLGLWFGLLVVSALSYLRVIKLFGDMLMAEEPPEATNLPDVPVGRQR